MAEMSKIKWWQWLPLPWKKWGIILKVASADMIPDKIPAKTAVLVVDNLVTTWIAFNCPCRRGHRVMLNIDRRRRPAWSVDQAKPLTLSPSVYDHTIDNLCHYFIKQGHVQWVPYNSNEERPNEEN